MPNDTAPAMAGRQQQPGDALPTRIRRRARRARTARGPTLASMMFSVERSSAARSSAEQPSEASVGAVIWYAVGVHQPHDDAARVAEPARDERVGGRRKARARRVGRITGRARAGRVERRDQALLDAAPAARRRGRLEHVRRRGGTADHVGRRGGALEVRAGELEHRLDEPEVGERVERRDDGVDDRLQRVFLRRAEVGAPAPVGVGTAATTAAARRHFRLRELPAVGD